ncbi:hypothetical protein Tsubulata_001789 [Turnera subulata]|uniref:DUF4283 domain-containing protein n=1 Tax=Turnera subulata TaxID=218843 RepID=A0A9Q0FIK5_9ROSI|nr:hypothetical protein Tsubulata_001789 [Turnera subulata]
MEPLRLVSKPVSKEEQPVLLGRIISDRIFCAYLVKGILQRAWNLVGHLRVKEMKPNIFLFTFDSEESKQRIFMEGPWSIQNKHIILKQWDPSRQLDEIDFTTTSFWVHVLGLPPSQMNKESAEIIGKQFFLKISNIQPEDEEDLRWVEFIRFKADLNALEPLVVGFDVEKEDGETGWVTL